MEQPDFFLGLNLFYLYQPVSTFQTRIFYRALWKANHCLGIFKYALVVAI